MTARPALRVAAASLVATLLAAAFVVAVQLVRLHAYEAARDRATRVVTGVVVKDSGSDGGIRVRWSDGRHAHLQRFSVYATERYRTGRTFPVAYDPADPTPTGYPGDPHETSAEDDLAVPTGIAAVVAALVLLGWLGRGLLFRIAARRRAEDVAVEVTTGERVATAGTQATPGLTSWVAVPGAGPSGTRWQRVMWHPALDQCRGPVTARVHGLSDRGRRVVVELAGARLVPIGRLRRRPPRGVRLVPATAGRVSLADAFVLPPGGRPRVRWWWRGALIAVTGALAGLVLAALVGSLVAAPLFVVSLAVLAFDVWAWVAPDP